MKYSVVVSSKTGNTMKLAEEIRKTLSENECVYFGEVNEKAIDADIIFVGFWTDKGTCDNDIKAFLDKLENKRIFIFGTAGYGGQESYFKQILGSVRKNIKESNTIEGSFMCQGKMPLGIRKRYEKMLSENPNDKKFEGLIENFDKALSHPDNNDLEKLEKIIKELII